MRKILTSIFVMFMLTTKVYADSLCPYKEQVELNQKAANVKVKYDVVEEIVHFIDMDAKAKVFEITLMNITDDLYVKVSNNVTKEEKVINAADTKDGVISFKWDEMEKVTNFTVQVYSSIKTSCPNEKYKTLYLTTPRYNDFYKMGVCQDYSEFYYCQEFVTFENVSNDKFFEKLESYKNEEIDKDGEEIVKPELRLIDRVINFLRDNKWYVLGIIVLGGTTVAVVKIVKNKKQRDLGL